MNDSPTALDDLTLHLAERQTNPAEAEQLARETLDWISKEIGEDYAWPGNIRELEQCVRNVMIRRAYRPPEKASRPADTEQSSNRNEFRGGKDKKKESGTAGQRKPLGVKERTMSISPSVEENVMHRKALSYERKGPIYKQKSIGIVELTLKLLSIALSCLVILFLHRANKIATNRYNALRQIQSDLDNRQHR